jgi:eukaryotic-like serine/threonine-protein kinase
MESRLAGGCPRAMSSTVAPKVMLAGRYRLVRRLASGGMGQVWRANDEILGRPVAVKLLRSEYAEDPEFVDRFRAEARRTAALSHPGIASVFDYGETCDPDEGTTAYLVMELVQGEPLSALLAREGRLSPAHTLDVVAQAALALDSAHLAGVVHRDVKPSNLLLRCDGVVKVTDFGIAHAADEAPRTEAGLVVGTAAYLSPEQVACRPATPVSDVYALGVVAYECLAGRRPFTGEHPIALALAHRRSEPPPLPEDVPESVCELVAWTMSKAPSARPHSAGALGRQALVTRTTLDEQVAAGDPRTLPACWFPMMSGWHPALGRARDPATAAPPTAPPTTAAPTTAAPAAGWPGAEAAGAPPTAPPPGAVAAGAGTANVRDAAATGRPAPAPARAERNAGAGHQVHGDGPFPGRPDEATGEWAAAPPPHDLPGAGGLPPHDPPGAGGLPPARAPAPAPLPRRRGSVVAAVVAITALLVGGAMAAARQRAYAVVPSVDGQAITVAGQALARAGFEVRKRSRPDATVRAGLVISQQPAAGARRNRGTLVTMVVSSGPPVVVLDPTRYLGRPLAPVRAAMIRLGLRVSVVGTPGRSGPGWVAAINPSGSLHQGDQVTVTVATGRRGVAGA